MKKKPAASAYGRIGVIYNKLVRRGYSSVFEFLFVLVAFGCFGMSVYTDKRCDVLGGAKLEDNAPNTNLIYDLLPLTVVVM